MKYYSDTCRGKIENKEREYEKKMAAIITMITKKNTNDLFNEYFALKFSKGGKPKNIIDPELEYQKKVKRNLIKKLKSTTLININMIISMKALTGILYI